MTGQPCAGLSHLAVSYHAYFLEQHFVQFGLIFKIHFLFAPTDFQQRRLGNIQVALINDFGHLPIKERQQKCADVGSIHISIRHDDDFMIFDIVDIVLFRSHPSSQGRDDILDFFATQDFVESGFFDV